MDALDSLDAVHDKIEAMQTSCTDTNDIADIIVVLMRFDSMTETNELEGTNFFIPLSKEVLAEHLVLDDSYLLQREALTIPAMTRNRIEHPIFRSHCIIPVRNSTKYH